MKDCYYEKGQIVWRWKRSEDKCQKMGRRKKMCEDNRDNVKVTESPEKKIVCTINIKIKY